MKAARTSWDRESSEMRYKRLQHLLEKSNIYSKFLLTKMEQQQLEEQRRKEKLERKREMMLKSAKGQNPVDGKEEKSGAKKKRGREDGTYNISEIMSKEEILSVAKKSKVENQDESSADSLHPEDLQKNGDSNSVIKDRLCQAVRHSAKQFLDPVRKFNGQPVPFQQPKIFTGGVMRWYQVEGMEWLRMLWENGINGILADEMGLGKTIQCIATIALMVERGVPGPFLIPLMLYHGAQQERRKLVRKIHTRQGSLQIYPVVVTSFEIAMRDRNALQSCYWKYLIVDEGHRIKNMNCRLIRELKRFNADNKLLLTGTPLQNNLAELWSLLNFLLPDVFDDLKSFESWFDITSITETAEDIIAKEREQNILHMLHQILTPFLLRRLKSDVALEVPPKREVVVYAPLAKKQETFYTAIVNRTIRKLLGNNEVDEDLVKNSGKFLLLDRMLPELKKRGHKVLLFSQMTMMLDILMDYCYLRDFKFSRLDGSMSYSEREENNPQSDLQAQDRCHRIGQTKPVVVYRLVTANTIDQKIVERAAAKRKLEKLIIHKNQFKGGKSGLAQSKSCLDPQELVELLKSRDYERPAVVLANTHTRALCLAQALSWCKSAMLSAHTASNAPRALSQLGRWLKLPLTSHCLSQAGRLAIQCAIYPTERSDSQQFVFDAGAARQAGPWGIIRSLWNNAKASPSPIPQTHQHLADLFLFVGVHDVALRIELQGRIELHVQHFESRHLHFHRAVGADLGCMLQLLGPHSDLAGAGGGAVPTPQLGALQRVIHRGHGRLHRTHRQWAAASPRIHTGSGSIAVKPAQNTNFRKCL
ncbi:hypothetical protein IHE44_0001689 [Lamprotornis superbus]|uniref:Helicase ATP-binding domain-containing protein n=1 Tax=Lamprotornis superbus TaxID=245042 RepID=A0A835NST4_9PASS|nr:hypothetical protein IHE44_0001689 [Lamprotornis superbus]